MQSIQFEGHLAVFRPGSYYCRHLDQFRGVELSTLTAMLCLNGDWTTEAGGALRCASTPTPPTPPTHFRQQPASRVPEIRSPKVLPARR
jgi:Rps23 Pro-64 3,4-dihydroxylase Tpa1-like proline 4-hydroxylase